MISLERLTSRVKDGIPNPDVDQKAYTDIKDRVLKRLDQGRKITADALDDALAYARHSATEASEFTKEQISRASERVRREASEASGDSTPTGEAIREKLQPSWPSTRMLLMASAAMGIATFLLGRVSTSPRKSPLYHRGDEVGPGLYVCRDCGTRLQTVSKDKLPRCSNCRGTEFREIG